jgi:hypothetical protein
MKPSVKRDRAISLSVEQEGEPRRQKHGGPEHEHDEPLIAPHGEPTRMWLRYAAPGINDPYRFQSWKLRER